MAPQPRVTQETLETRIRGEFTEMPGLCLTLAQARRLWGLDGVTCARTLDHLMTEGFLRRSGEIYLRADGLHPVAA